MDPSKAVEQRVKVELTCPVAHDFILYSRGLHELDADLARLFLTFKDPVSHTPLVRLASLSSPDCPTGTKKLWPS